MTLLTKSMRTTTLPSGEAVPVLGQGTWHLAEGRRPRAQEIMALQTGLDLGMRLIDTAEIYANGGAEELVGEAIAGRRDEVFLVSKVLPSHATRRGTVAACEHSLQRLRTNRLDLYLLHWPGTVPLERTLAGFSDLLEAGKIRYWGVSNFDRPAMLELEILPGGKAVTTDQVLYNLTRRGIEYDLLPWCHEQNIPVIAYSPIEQGRLLHHPVLKRIAQHHQATPAQVALAWVLRQDGIIAIPQAGDPSHVRENQGALDVKPTTRDLEALDQAFSPPREPEPLAML